MARVAPARHVLFNGDTAEHAQAVHVQVGRMNQEINALPPNFPDVD